MADKYNEAEETLRQAQEGSRVAQENVRVAQEGVREIQEHGAGESRQHSETGRNVAEDGRVAAEGKRVDAENLRSENDNIMVMDPDLNIISASKSYLKMTMTDESIFGKYLFDAFPDTDKNEDSKSKVLESLDCVRETKEAHEMGLLEYPIKNSDGTMEKCWWKVTNIPVIGENGEIDQIINKVSRVRDLDEFGKRMQGERNKLRDKLKVEFYTIYAVLLILGVFAAAWGENVNDRQVENNEQIIKAQKQTILAQREGCKRTNVLRENQASYFIAEVRERKKLLRNPGALKNLEGFRPEIEQGLRRFENSLQSLKDSANHGNASSKNPYTVNCNKAYPLPNVEIKKGD